LSGALTRPDPMAAIAALARRLDNLERRTTPAPPGLDPNSHTHAGTGYVSTVVPLAAQSPTASGDGATAMGADAVASDTDATAVGVGAQATHFESAAFGPSTETLGDRQIVVGRADKGAPFPAPWVVLAAPASVIDDAHLGKSKICFYLNEGSNTLVVKVKYANGTTIKTGTIALT
jgi:hypothetical protein